MFKLGEGPNVSLNPRHYTSLQKFDLAFMRLEDYRFELKWKLRNPQLSPEARLKLITDVGKMDFMIKLLEKHKQDFLLRQQGLEPSPEPAQPAPTEGKGPRLVRSSFWSNASSKL